MVTVRLARSLQRRERRADTGSALNRSQLHSATAISQRIKRARITFVPRLAESHEDRNCIRLTIRLNRAPRYRHRDKGATETLWLWPGSPNDVTSHRRIATFMDIC
jgi:hypothetical protein